MTHFLLSFLGVDCRILLLLLRNFVSLKPLDEYIALNFLSVELLGFLMLLILEGHVHRIYTAMFWLLLVQTDLCHQWKFFWGNNCCKMAKMYYQTHVHASRDTLDLSTNPKTWQNIFSMAATNAILSCLNLIKVPTIWLVRSVPAISFLFLDLPAYSALQSKITQILLGLAGWHNAWWGKYHTFPSTGVSLEILAYHLLRISSINSLLWRKCFESF